MKLIRGTKERERERENFYKRKRRKREREKRKKKGEEVGTVKEAEEVKKMSNMGRVDN